MVEHSEVRLPNVGERLAERYTIVERVSYGGFGAVYKAIQDTLGREVAIKVLLPEIFLSNQDYVEQFRQEALLTSQLRHPNTITIFDYGQTDSSLLFLVMEWLDGQTLADVLRDAGALAYERVYHIAYQILKSLSEAHDRGMVHRDLKPSNLFLCTQYGEADYVKVLDFGLVKNLTSEPLQMKGKRVDPPKFTEKRRAPGTPHYMAPEQATGKGTTTSADMYSFGLIVHEMLTGKRAVDGADKMEVLLRQARDAVPALPDELTATFLGRVVARCVDKDPLKRPQKAGELVREFQRVEDSAGVEVNTSEIRTTDHWRPLAKPRSLVSEVSSGPDEHFVGRNQELEEFANILAKRMQAAQGIVMTVSGPTGIGKSALVRHFAAHFTERAGDGMVVRGGFLPYDHQPLAGFRRALRNLLNVQAAEHSEGRHEIRRGLEAIDVQDFYLLNFLTNFLLGAFGSTPDEIDECTSRVGDFLERIAQRAPMLFVLENLDWADAASLELLWRLAVGPSRQWPLFLIGSFRVQDQLENRELQLILERLNRLDHAAYREMRLGPLGKRECFTVIEHAISMQRPMANRCLALSKGNPLFLNLVLRYLIDEAEHLSRQMSDSGGITSKLYLPSSLEKISLRRVDQVVRKYGQEPFREVLKRAALVGESFAPELLEALIRREGKYDLLDRLPRTLELWRREGVLRKPWEAENTTEFVHPHLVEFFFSDADAKLQLLAAKTKEAAANAEGGAPIDPADLARHYQAAGEPQQAIRFLLEAANAARERHNLVRARRLYEELLPLVSGDSSEQRGVAKRTFQLLGDICLHLSELGPSSDYYDHAMNIARADGDRQLEAMCLCGKADLSLALNRLDDADRLFHRARGLIADTDRKEQGRLLLGMGRVSSLKGDWEAAQSCFQRAYEFGGGVQEAELMAHALHELGRTATQLGNYRAAHEWFDQALKQFRVTHNAAAEAHVLVDLADTMLFYRRVEDARKCIELAIETEQRLGDQIGVAQGLTALGALEASILHVDEAQKVVLRALPLFKTHGHRNGLARCQTVLSQLDLINGHYDNAESLARQALELVEELGAIAQQAFLMARLGLLALYQGHPTRAQETLEQALMLLDVHGSDSNRTIVLHHLGLCHEVAGNFDVAEEHFRRAYEVAQRGEWFERQYTARLAIIRMAVFKQGGRWYYDELWEMAQESRSYGMRQVQLEVLMALAWFEGVYGDHAGWEQALAELNHNVRLHRIPAQGLLHPFEALAQAAQHLAPEQSASFQRSAGWLRQSVEQSLASAPST